MRRELPRLHGLVISIGVLLIAGCYSSVEPPVLRRPTTQPTWSFVWKQPPPAWLQIKADATFVTSRLPAAAWDDYETSFVEGYSEAVVSPDATITTSGKADDPSTIGFDAGVAVGKYDAPLPLAQFMALFAARGYTELIVSGVYSSGFEKSQFIPDNDPHQWWLDWTPYLSTRVPQGPLTITGLVSPPGMYGHMNMSHREFLVLTAKPDK